MNKGIKKILRISVVLAMIISIITISQSAYATTEKSNNELATKESYTSDSINENNENSVQSRTVQNNLRAATPDAAFSIDASGNITAYDESQNPNHPQVSIPQTINGTSVIGIANDVFKSKKIEVLELPEGLQKIGYGAFSSNLFTELILPSTLKSIDSYAFGYCHQLKSLKIPSGVTELKGGFSCQKLSEIEIPSTVTKIVNDAFNGIANGAKIRIKGKTLGGVADAPWGALNPQIYWENSLQDSSNYYVDNSGVLWGLKPDDELSEGFDSSKIIIPSTVNGVEVVEIRNNAFAQNKMIKEVSIPSSVKKVGTSAFNFCENIKVLTLAEGVQTLGPSAFYKCTSIQKVVIPKSITKLTNTVFSYCTSLTEIVLPETLTELGYNVFNECANLQKIKIPEGVSTIGKGAFGSCTSLNEVILPNSLTTIDQSAFYWCRKLNHIELPSNLKTINDYAFQYAALYDITLPESVTTVGTAAFDTQNPTGGKFVLNYDTNIYTFPEDIDLSKVTVTGSDLVFNKEKRTVSFAAPEGSKNTVTKNIEYNYLVENSTVSLTMNVTATCSEKQAIVKFKYYDDHVYSFLVSYTRDAISPGVLQRAGYTFIGWDKPLTTILEDTTFTAQYKAFPINQTKDIEIFLNAKFDPIDYINVVDADGKKISNITISKNEVDINQLGEYDVEFNATDQWGGKTTGTFKVKVVEEPKLLYKTLQDSKTDISASALMDENAKLDIRVIEPKDNPLYSTNKMMAVLGSYEITITGNFTGKVKLVFVIDKEYEGKSIYIKHKLQNGTVDTYTEIVKDGVISIEVDELSPFLLTVDKTEIVPDNPHIPESPTVPESPLKPEISVKPETPKEPTKPKEPSETDSDKKVETGDTVLLSVYTASTLIAICVFIGFKKKKSVK